MCAPLDLDELAFKEALTSLGSTKWLAGMRWVSWNQVWELLDLLP